MDSNISVTFNEKASAALKQAGKDLGLELNGTLSLSVMLLQFAAAAKKQGRNMAVVQTQEIGNQGYIAVDTVLNLKMLSTTDGISYDLPCYDLRGTHFNRPTMQVP